MVQNRNAIVITNPMIAANKSMEVTLGKFLRVLSSAFDKIQVIGGNISINADIENVTLHSYPIRRANSKYRRILNVLVLQLKMVIAVLKNATKGQPVFFWIGDKMILPFLAAKLKRCEINYFIYGNTAKEGNASVFAKLSSHLIRWMARNADYACAESESVFGEWPGLTVHHKRIIHLYTEHIEMIPFEERTNTIGMLCRLAPGKHVIESVHAFYELHKVYPEWKMEIFGSGVQEEECKQLIEKLHADNYIQMRGWIDHEKVVACTSHWKFLLFPTDTEGMPNSVIEMMGKGIPVIASPVGGINDIVTHGKNGYILREKTISCIFQSIEMCICNEENYVKLSEAAHQRICDCYSLSSAQDNILNNCRNK